MERKQSLSKRLYKDRWELLMLLPTVILLFLFCYLPIYGILIAFQNYSIGNPILAFDGSIKWVGFDHFIKFIQSIFFTRVFGNTIRLSLKNLAFGFLVPIIFALLLNEIRANGYKRVVQTFAYMPYFVSVVVVVAMLKSMTTAALRASRTLSSWPRYRPENNSAVAESNCTFRPSMIFRLRAISIRFAVIYSPPGQNKGNCLPF